MRLRLVYFLVEPLMRNICARRFCISVELTLFPRQAGFAPTVDTVALVATALVSLETF